MSQVNLTVVDGIRLQKLEDCNISAHGEPIVTPIDINFVLKKEGKPLLHTYT